MVVGGSQALPCDPQENIQDPVHERLWCSKRVYSCGKPPGFPMFHLSPAMEKVQLSPQRGRNKSQCPEFLLLVKAQSIAASSQVSAFPGCSPLLCGIQVPDRSLSVESMQPSARWLLTTAGYGEGAYECIVWVQVMNSWESERDGDRGRERERESSSLSLGLY